MAQQQQQQSECPNGRNYTGKPNGRKSHCFQDVSRTRLPKGDKRGDWHVITKCKFCNEVKEYDCISAYIP